MAERIPGPICVTTARSIDQGTLCRSDTQRPGPIVAEVVRSRHRSDAFDLCVAASALGFAPAVTEQLVDQVSRAMLAAIVHSVSTFSEFVAMVEEYSAALLLASPQARNQFIKHHRRNFDRLHITGQTFRDTALGDVHIAIVGEHALLSARVFVERHERGHVGLAALGVPWAQHHGILNMLELGGDRTPCLGIRVGLRKLYPRHN